MNLRTCDEPGCIFRGRHAENCDECFGFGFFKDEDGMDRIAGASEVGKAELVPCDVCGGLKGGEE